MDRIVFLNVTWMERYEGLKGDDRQVSGGGSYVDKYGYGHEIYNFKNINGKVYGYAQPRGANNLERMGANQQMIVLIIHLLFLQLLIKKRVLI